MNAFRSFWIVTAILSSISCVSPLDLFRKPAQLPPPPPARNLLGINLNYGTTDDYSEDRLFADAMKQARLWYRGNSFETPAALDARFWPTEDASLCVMDLRRNEGTYRCSFTGRAVVSPGPWGLGGGRLQNQSYDPVSGRTTFEIVITEGVGAMTLTFTQTSGGIRDLKIMRPRFPGSSESYPEGTLFTDQIQALVSKFRVIRFMDYLRTNGNQLVRWADRPQPDDASFNSEYRRMADTVWTNPDTGVVTTRYSSPGGCYEYAVDLCNQTGCDLWLNVPLKADDDFVRHLAALVRDRLRSDLNVYVEYSNEIWNTAPGFSQGNQNHDLAMADVAAGVLPALNPNGDLNDWDWASRRVGRRTVEISNLFREVWGDGAMPAPGKASPRVRPVLQGQQGNLGGFQDLALMYIDRNFPKPVSWYLYGGGGSGYYNPTDTPGLTFEALWSDGSMDPRRWLDGWAMKEAAAVRTFGLKRICYEGGPSFDEIYPNSSSQADMDEAARQNDLRKQAWASPRMQQNLVDHVDRAWSQADGDLFVFYASAGDHRWAFTQDIFDLDTPKLRAIDQLNRQTRAPSTQDRVPPFTADGVDFAYQANYGSYPYAQGSAYVIGKQAYLVYSFRLEAEAAVTASLGVGETTGPFGVFCDGIPAGSVPAGPNNGPVSLSLGRLGPGLHALLVRTEETGVRVNTVRFQQAP